MRNPDAQDGVSTRVETSVETYDRNSAMEKVFAQLGKLPTYSVDRVPRMGDVKRLLRLAGLLVHEGVDADADEYVRKELLKKLKALRDKCAAERKDWTSLVQEGGEIEVDVSRIATGGMSVAGKTSARVALVEENVDQLFEDAGRLLASGEGLHRTYWKCYHEKDRSNEAKLELFAVLGQSETLPEMESLGRQLFDAMWASIKALFSNFRLPLGRDFSLSCRLPERQPFKRGNCRYRLLRNVKGEEWPDHLYCAGSDGFFAKLNGWKKQLLEQEMKKEGFVAWLRNRHDENGRSVFPMS